MPIEYNGTPVGEVSVNGQPIDEVTVNGDTVFTADPPVIEDFEDGNINGWNHITEAGGSANISNTAFNSSHSINVSVTTAGVASVAYFDSLGTKDFTQNYVLSAYLRLGGSNSPIGSIGYIYNTSNTTDVLACGVDDEDKKFFIEYDEKPQGFGGARASTTFNPTTGIWYKVELEFDGSDHIGRLYDDSDTLLETITWASSSAQAENSAYVATMQCAGKSNFHEHFVDDIALSI